MVSFGARQAFRVITAIIALVTCAAAPYATAADIDAGLARHRQLLQRIQQILARDGPYSSDLLEPLVDLIALYRQGDDEALAVAAIERALQVVRIDKGLHTLDQVPLIQQLIRVEEQRGNHESAWEIEHDLLTLVRRYPDDLRTVPVLREVGDRRMAALGRFLAGERPPEVVLGCFYEAWPQRYDANCQAGSRKTVVQGMLAEAQQHYSAGIAVLLRHERFGDDELRDLELSLLRGIDLVRKRYDSDPRRDDLPLVPGMQGSRFLQPWRSRTEPVVELASWSLPSQGAGVSKGGNPDSEAQKARIGDTYHRGRQSLRRLYAYGAASASSPLTLADAAVQVADWELLYSRHGVAVEGYQRAYDLLQSLGVERASIEQLFAPPLPVVLPAFQPNPFARDETRKPTRYIDVAFKITRYGRGREIEILGSSYATDAELGRLVSFIMTSRFRPRPTDGKFAESSRVATRYYLSETP
jgi:hypothetical protein